MKYVIYLRVSTDQQAESGLGLEAQRIQCLKFIPENANKLEFSDEGFSGALSVDKRPALMQAINSLCRDDVLLVAKRDRLGRDTLVNAIIERMVERRQAKLMSATGDFNNSNDPSSILMRRMIDAFAEYERLIIGARTKAALQVKKSRNERIGTIPFGYRLHENNVNLIPDEREQKINIYVHSRRKQGAKLREIADELNSRDERTRRASLWTPRSICELKKNSPL
jgi:DNA invertase Pin-like site-specific DNA recombinase